MPGTSPAILQQYSGTREILFRKHFAFFDRRLVESINSEKMRGDNRLQHEMHHKFAKGFFTEPVDVNGPHRTAILGERLGSGAGFRRHEIANCLTRKSWFAREFSEFGIHTGTPPCTIDGDNREQFVPRPADEQLELAMLIDGPECRKRGGSLAVLAETFGPQLHVPMRETLQ